MDSGQQPVSGDQRQDGAERRRLPWITKVLYASGSAGNGIKKAGLAGFLLIYYNQVVGLPAALVGSALAIALIVDAIADPLVGQTSDHLNSRWGRRHPFMYGSILPVSIAFTLLWMAPVGWSESQLFVYLLSLVLAVRIFDTFFEIPAAALLAEMTTDYDERTAILSMRYIFGTVAALGMKFVAYRYFFTPQGDDESGVLNRLGFVHYGLTAGLIICGAILLACIGTHGQIKHLHRPPRRTITLVAIFKEMLATLSNRSWVALTTCGGLIAVAKGGVAALNVYFLVYFWGLKGKQISLLVGADLIASVLGALAAMHIARRMGKRNAAMLMLIVTYTAFALPITLKLFGIAPHRGSDALLAYLMGVNLIQEFTGMVAAVLFSSMAIDLVEDSQMRTGRRSEGLLVAADNLLQKAVAGAGVFVSGLVLAAIHFPERARPGKVPAETIHALGLIVVSSMTPLYIAAVLCLSLYRIDRAGHDRNVANLRAASTPEQA